MKTLFFAETDKAVLKTNIFRAMVHEAMKAIELVTPEMVLAKTSGVQLYFPEVTVFCKNYDGKRTVKVSLELVNSDRVISFEVPYQIDDFLGWDDGFVAINYEKEYVRIVVESEECLTMKDLTEAFGKNLMKKNTVIGSDYWFSMKAFPEINF